MAWAQTEVSPKSHLLTAGAAKTLDLHVILVSAPFCAAQRRRGLCSSAAMCLYVLSCFDIFSDCSRSWLPNSIFRLLNDHEGSLLGQRVLLPAEMNRGHPG